VKILLTSDWQLGAGAELGQGDHGPGSRFQDQVDVLGRIATLAAEEQVGLVAMFGDTFERARPAPSSARYARSSVRDGRRQPIPRSSSQARYAPTAVR
jgi:DNA repair exonuclease SbcCD nuclease subunit